MDCHFSRLFPPVIESAFTVKLYLSLELNSHYLHHQPHYFFLQQFKQSKTLRFITIDRIKSFFMRCFLWNSKMYIFTWIKSLLYQATYFKSGAFSFIQLSFSIFQFIDKYLKQYFVIIVVSTSFHWIKCKMELVCVSWNQYDGTIFVVSPYYWKNWNIKY